MAFKQGTGYDYPDLPGLGNNNEKLGLPERLSTGIQFRFKNLFHGKKSGNRSFICIPALSLSGNPNFSLLLPNPGNRSQCL
jgi:hypothetical protein